jgi:hypothetical protein
MGADCQGISDLLLMLQQYKMKNLPCDKSLFFGSPNSVALHQKTIHRYIYDQTGMNKPVHSR